MPIRDSIDAEINASAFDTNDCGYPKGRLHSCQARGGVGETVVGMRIKDPNCGTNEATLLAWGPANPGVCVVSGLAFSVSGCVLSAVP